MDVSRIARNMADEGGVADDAGARNNKAQKVEDYAYDEYKPAWPSGLWANAQGGNM
jgi:hypothetical protein